MAPGVGGGGGKSTSGGRILGPNGGEGAQQYDQKLPCPLPKILQPFMTQSPCDPPTAHHTTLVILFLRETTQSEARFCKTLWHRFCSTLKKPRFLRPKLSLGLPAKLPNKCNVWYMILQLWVWRSPKVRAPPWPSFAIPLLLHFASLDLPTAARQEGLNTFLTFLRKVALTLAIVYRGEDSTRPTT